VASVSDASGGVVSGKWVVGNGGVDRESHERRKTDSVVNGGGSGR
jgi:hypothetical protein